MNELLVESAHAASGVPVSLDPSDPDPARRRLLLDWLRLQSAFVFRPEEACRGLRDGLSPAVLWRRAGARPARGVQAVEPGSDSWRSLESAGVQVLPWTSPAYPERLKRLDDAPPLLFVQGDVALLAQRAVALVGARAATTAGNRMAHELARALGEVGVPVVSGLARGVDARAHEGALAGGGTTIAVQARGPDDVYPREHRDLARRIRDRGVLVTEFPPRTPPRPAHFPLRNRLISALSALVVVVEARERSGSLITARHALDQGVEVLVVPGPVDGPAHRGTNQLLRDGAGVVLEAADVLLALGLESTAVRSERGPRELPDSEPPMQRRVMGALEEGPVTRDELALRLDCEPHALALALVELTLAGRVEEERDGRLQLVTGA